MSTAAAGSSTLTGSKHLWLYSEENVPEKHRDHFEALRASDLKTARAWALKEVMRGFWGYRSSGWAVRFFNRWYFWATHSRLKPMIEAAKMLKRHRANIITYFAH